MAEKDSQYGLIAIIISVFFLVSSLGLLENNFFNQEFASLLAYIFVAVGAYEIARTNKKD
jgi:hypothetical protein